MAARFRCLTAFDKFNHRLRSGEVPFQVKESCGTIRRTLVLHHM
jgi:hypothetical protein